MAADTAETVLVDIRVGGMKGAETTEAELAEIRSHIRGQYETQSDPYYATSRLWDDGLIDPVHTRDALGLALALAARHPEPAPGPGLVYRM
jgi:3-methylcrotonyl-CoA carboxylase beta subunit